MTRITAAVKSRQIIENVTETIQDNLFRVFLTEDVGELLNLYLPGNVRVIVRHLQMDRTT